MLRHACIPFLIVTACGASAPQPQPQAPIHANATSEAPARVPYFAIVSTAWARSYVRAPDADVEAWAVDPANAKTIVPPFRHILIRLAPGASATEIAAATKRVNAVLARVQHGEDFATVANETSEDIGSRRSGGVLPGADLSVFVEPFRDAAQALAPGEVTKQPVRTVFGLHVIKRDALDLETKRAAFRVARAPAVARELAERIARMDDVKDAMRAVLDAQALSSPARPQLTAFAPATGDAKEDAACARARQSSSANVAALEQGEGFVVVKTMSAAFRSSAPPALCALENEDVKKIREALERLKAEHATP